MKGRLVISALFVVAALYDGIIGLAFLLAPNCMFDYFCVAPPNHMGYVQFPAALLLVFTVMFLAIAQDPKANRNLIPFGIMLKTSYCGVVFRYWFSVGIPDMWKPFALADILFLVLFLMSYAYLGKKS